MLNLRFWLRDQGLSVRELASNLDVPLPTVEDWAYRGAAPSEHNAELLHDFISATCAHHWVIEAANGPVSEGVCQRCGKGGDLGIQRRRGQCGESHALKIGILRRS